MMKKTLHLIFITAFILACAAPFIGRLLGYQNVNAEKRQLAAVPSIVSNGTLNMAYAKQFDNYFGDNFAFRTDLITMNARFIGSVFGESVSDRVIMGKDGWLFYRETLNDYMKVNCMSDNEIYRLYRTLQIQKTYLESRGIGFIFTVAPNKNSLYGEYMPDRYIVSEEKNNTEKLYAVLDREGFDYVNLHRVLRDSEIQLYHKLDHHWNNAGALFGYNALLDKVKELNDGYTFRDYKELIPKEEYAWHGDLSAMLYPAADVLDVQYTYDIKKEYKTESPMKSPEELLIETACKNGSLKLVFFRDSFANALVSIMSNAFAEVTYTRATPYDYSFVNEDTDVVMMEIVERNLANLIKQAPVMPAYTVELKEEPAQTKLEASVVTEETGNLIRIAGFAVPPEHDANRNYIVYARLYSGNSSYTFEPFPIQEEGKFADKTKANVSFSMTIDKSSLPQGEYSLDIILDDGSRLMKDTADISITLRQ
ncbi:MAG: alginate O-acetyltransferase AlgX-related protein [Christensenellales bacterium]